MKFVFWGNKDDKEYKRWKVERQVWSEAREETGDETRIGKGGEWRK